VHQSAVMTEGTTSTPMHTRETFNLWKNFNDENSDPDNKWSSLLLMYDDRQ